MAREGYGVVVRMTQAQVDNGEADNLVGKRIEIIDASSQPTGVVYEAGASGQAPSQVATAATVQQSTTGTINQVSGTGVVTLTQATVDAGGTHCHLNDGITGLTLTAADWTASRIIEVVNVSTSTAIPVSIGTGWTRARTPTLSLTAAGDLLTLEPGEWFRASISNGYLNVVAVSGGGRRLHTTWTANTRYEQGDAVYANAAQGSIGIGDLIIRTTGGTSAATFTTTEAAKWTEVAEDPDVLLKTANLSGLANTATARTNLGLGNVDNTSDVNKPISTAAQTALDRKAGKAVVKDRDTVTDGLTGRLLHLRSENLATGALATWADESGGARDVAQATTTSQPAVTANAIGTKQAVRFDGSADFLSRTAVDLGANWTIATVVRTGAALTGQILSDNYPSAVSFMLGLNTAGFGGGTTNAPVVGTFSGTWVAAVAPTVAAVNTTYILTATRTQGGNLVLRVNGQQVASVAAGTNPTFESGGTLYVGRRWDTAASTYWNGDIGEIMLFNRVLSAEELEIAEGMLAHKFESMALFPTAHTYSADAPAVINAPVPNSVVTGALALASTGTPVMDGTAALGTAATAAHADHVHPTDTSRASTAAATTTTAGLMSATDKSKVDGVATGAAAVGSTVGTALGTAAAGAATTAARSDHVHPLPAAATTSVAGLMSATDKSKLDGVATSAAAVATTGTPAMNGTAALGTTTTAARSDHVHPSDTTREATANKGAANGYAGLGADARVPFAQLPATIGLGFRLWIPADLGTIRAIDIDFEGAALGTLSSIANAGSLGGTATAAVGEEPTIDAADATGRRGALFDGTNDSLRSSAIWSLGTTYGLFAVYRRAAAGSGFVISTEYPTNVAYTLGQVQDAVNNGVGGNMVFVGHFNGAWRSHAANSVLASALGIVVGNFDAANINVRIAGTDSTAAQTSLSATPSGNTRIGRRWDTAGNNYFAGRIFRILCKAGAFTAAEMQQLEGWAAHRFGTAASLPAAHPYRNNPPIVAL